MTSFDFALGETAAAIREAMYVALNSARAYVDAVARACDAARTTRFDALTGRELMGQ